MGELTEITYQLREMQRKLATIKGDRAADTYRHDAIEDVELAIAWAITKLNRSMERNTGSSPAEQPPAD